SNYPTTSPYTLPSPYKHQNPHQQPPPPSPKQQNMFSKGFKAYKHTDCQDNRCAGRDQSAGHHSDCLFDGEDQEEYQLEEGSEDSDRHDYSSYNLTDPPPPVIWYGPAKVNPPVVENPTIEAPRLTLNSPGAQDAVISNPPTTNDW